jgi:hypothetical protein
VIRVDGIRLTLYLFRFSSLPYFAHERRSSGVWEHKGCWVAWAGTCIADRQTRVRVLNSVSESGGRDCVEQLAIHPDTQGHLRCCLGGFE